MKNKNFKQESVTHLEERKRKHNNKKRKMKAEIKRLQNEDPKRRRN